MLGGSPRGGDGTNVVLNEGIARRLDGLYRKGIPVVASVRNNPIFLEAVLEAEISVGGGVSGVGLLRPLQQPPLRFERR